MSRRKHVCLIAIIAYCLVFALATAIPAARQVAAGKENEQEKLVHAFMAAFNAHQVDQMLALVDERVQWLNVDGSKITVETEGRQALRASLEKYFRSCPSCQSSLEWLQVAGSRVTAKEKASWRSKDETRAQSSLSVYEFQQGKILRVYYFPAEAEKNP
jgi:hypothetical protein